MMEVQRQLILTASIVYIGLMSVQSHDRTAHQATTSQIDNKGKIQKNFQNLFNAIAKNDAGRSEIHSELLNQEVMREQQTFDTMKEQLQVARHRNAYKKINFYDGRNNAHENAIAVKRETYEKKPRVTKNFSWYERHTTQSVDTEPPDVEYQEILFQATEMMSSAKFQLEAIMEAYNSTNWYKLKDMRLLPDLFNKTTRILDGMNRTIARKVDLGFHFARKDQLDPVDKVTAEKLTDCFREMKVYVDRFQTEQRGLEDRDLRKATIEMRLQINTAIQELEMKVPDLLEQMRILRTRVTKGPY